MKKSLNLYLISQTNNDDWDTYDSAVVAATSEEEAQLIHPSGDEKKNLPGKPDEDGDYYKWRDWTPRHEEVSVKLIGKAAKGIDAGVICSSFHAG